MTDAVFELGERLGADGLVERRAGRYRGRAVEVRTLAVPEALAEKALPHGEADAAKAEGLAPATSVPVLGFVQQRSPFVVTPGVSEPRLRHRIAQGDLTPEAILRIALDVARALADGHARELLHGAVRPDAIAVAPDGTARLDDWVIGRALAHLGQNDAGVLEAVGRYYSPELAAGSPMVPASDVFAWASTFFEALAGRPAFDGATSVDRLMAIATGQLPAFGDAIPKPLLPLFKRAFGARPKDRPRAQDLVDALVAHLGEADPRRPAPAPARPRVEPSAEEPIDPLDVPTLRHMEIPNHVPDSVGLFGARVSYAAEVDPLDAPTLRDGVEQAPDPLDERTRPLDPAGGWVPSPQALPALPPLPPIARPPAPRPGSAQVTLSGGPGPAPRPSDSLLWVVVGLGALLLVLATALGVIWLAG